jgi:hypothetical protein
MRYGDMAMAIPFVALAGYGIGYGLDQVFGTTWIRAFSLILCIVGAFANLVMQVLKDQKSK